MLEEKPQIRKVISQLRERDAATGRTVRVADKGLDCADDVADAALARDGYIFSKSVKGLPAAERAWALSDEGWADVGDGHGGVLYRIEEAAGYNMIVTSETGMPVQEIYAAYHRLWRIEESFRVMKSELDARPVYLQRQSTVTGHFLVCYIAVLLVRLLQEKVLGGRYRSEDVMGLLRGLNVCQVSERKYVNVSRRAPIIEEIAERTGLPLLHFNLSRGDVRAISGCTLRTLMGGKGASPASGNAAEGFS